MRSGLPAFFLERLLARTRATWRCFACGMALALLVIACRFLPRAGRGLAATRWSELYARAPGLRQADRNGLLRRRSTMFSLADMVHLLPHKFARLRAGRLAFACIFPGSLESLFFRHGLTPETTLVPMLAKGDRSISVRERDDPCRCAADFHRNVLSASVTIRKPWNGIPLLRGNERESTSRCGRPGRRDTRAGCPLLGAPHAAPPRLSRIHNCLPGRS